jgi:transposase-like protein
VLTVGNDVAGVERMLADGELRCPSCGGRLSRWGFARERVFFGPGRSGQKARPRRSRCAACQVTHVLLPARLLARRADEAVVIGAALTAVALGAGCRRAAAELGVPADTVRGWVRRAAGQAGLIREAFTRTAGALSPDPVPLEPAGSPLADAVAAVAAAASAAAARWPGLLAVSPWQVAAAVTDASLLLPVMTARPANTSCL